MLYKFNRWLWLKCNKKPPTKLDAYLVVVAPWFMAGFLGGVSAMIFTSGDIELVARIALGCVGLFLVATYIWLGVGMYSKEGIIGRIHEAAIDRWHRKNKEYGVEIKVGGE